LIRRMQSFVMALGATWLSSCAATPSSTSTTSQAGLQRELLFDGRQLGAWKPTNFGGEGEIVFADDHAIFELGNPLTGITWNGSELPRENYALVARARKLSGHDFFCGLTFPIGEEHASLILGGWGGTTCGLSCIDGRDASENATTHYRRIENDRLYSVRIEVYPDRVRAWLDQELLFEVERAKHRFAVRAELRSSQPLGYGAFATRTALHSIELESLVPAEINNP
jgi:hypothetical protein